MSEKESVVDSTVINAVPTTEEQKKQLVHDAPNKEKKPEAVNAIDSGTDTVAAKATSESSTVSDRPDLIYEGDKCISVDPVTKARYLWDGARSEWIPENPGASQPDSSNNYHFDGSTYTYTDTVTKIKYKWDVEKNAWTSVDETSVNKSTEESISNGDSKASKDTASDVDKSNNSASVVYGYENGTHTYTDPSDNTAYIWDRDKKAWFPKVDEDFLAQYQMNYGFVDQTNKEEEEVKDVEEQEKKDIKAEKRKAQQEPPTWFDLDEENNTKVYVSNLPLDITEQEFVDLMQKCGLVMKEPDNNKMKVKLYIDAESKLLKGDGLCTYIRKESVELALNLLDGSEYRGRKLCVEKAKFTMKGNAYDPSLKPKKKKRKDKEKIKLMQEKLFDWRPDKLRGERARNESVVIIKNLFEPSIFEKDVKLILEFQQDLREECIKCGAVKRVIIYDRNPEGVGQVSFKEPEAADACIQLLNGRWFNKRKISAETWDGKTKYRVVETREQMAERLAKWNKYLQVGEKANTEESKEDQNIETDKTSEEKCDTETQSKETCDTEKQNKETCESDSDQDTKSSVDSEYTTDEEM